MRSNYLPSVLLALCAVHGVFSIPLNLAHSEATTDEEKENLGRLTAAKDEANSQITKMEKVLADPTNEKHKPLIEAAFGKDPSLDLNHVKTNVGLLKKGTINVHLPTEGDSKTMAFTHYNTDKKPMEPQTVAFGKKYHKAALSTQAGTMIHEATHFLGNTGDHIHNGAMLKGNDPKDVTGLAEGYTSKQSMYKTPKALNGDKIWTDMRDSTKNMHDNAEAYGQFASLCANANLRRDLHMYRRALAVGDGETAAYYLTRRNSCALPKDYFAKKAAAKKAADAKTGAKTTGAKVASTKKTTGAKTLSSKGKAGAAKSLLKNAKTVGRVASKSPLGKSKIGAVKHLANGRVAKSVSKVAGSRRPVSKAAAGKRLTTKAGNKHAVKSTAGSKHVARPTTKGRTAKAATGGKRVGRPTTKRVAKAAGNKHVARPTVNKHAVKTAAGKRITKAATKHTAKPAQRASRPAVHQAKPAQRQAKAVAKAAPKPAAQKTIAKVAPKKGRRDLELEYPL